MESIKAQVYELKFRIKYLESTGDSFQNLFSSIMEMRYPGDFVRVRPWGKTGDKKNDGYLRSKRKLFQCYAPKESKPIAKWTKKIKEDFTKALPYWEEHFDYWILTHNDQTGLPAEVLKLLLELTEKHSPIEVIHWGYAELLSEFKALSGSDLLSLFGPAVELKDLVMLQVSDIRDLLEHLTIVPDSAPSDVRPVPQTKLQYNQLSSSAANLLRLGMTKADIVKKYLRGLADPTKHDRIAAAFKKQYQCLRAEGHMPDLILAGLQRFIVGEEIPSPSRQAGTLAILAFLFEECDIFERPPDETTLTS